MRVLHLSNGPLSGAPYRLMQVQRLGGLEARLIFCQDWNTDYDYPCDVSLADADLVAQLLTAAEIVHYHNHWRDSLLFQTYPWAWDVARRKPSVVQLHTPRRPEFEAALREPALGKLVVAQYHARLYPECLPVPNAVPIDDPLHRPLFQENDPPCVAFTPSGCEGRGWRDKGCPETLAVLRNGFHHRFVTAAPWRETMEIRQRCDIAIDEVMTGSYHMCSLEALSQGLATVAGLDSLTVDVLEKITGTREHPWIVARPETLDRELRRLVADADHRWHRRREARAYMEAHWNTQAICRHFRAAYAAVLERCG